MLAAQRHERILREARLRGTVRVSELSARLGVSTVTIRRDITQLVDQGELIRVHGGATLPTTGASAASGGRSRRGSPRATVGMVVPSASYYYPEVIRGAEAAAAAAGVRLVLAISHYHHSEERDQVSRLVQIGVDGLLIATSEAPDTDPAIASWLSDLDVPVVLVERRIEGPGWAALDYVRSDHAAGAQAAVAHLQGLGHRHVGLAARLGSPTSRWLFEGHRALTGAVDGSEGEPLVADLPGPGAAPRRRAKALNRFVDTLLESGATAALVHVDEDAMTLVQLARKRALEVPGDLAVIAYDDEVAKLADIPLTAVAPPKRDVGRTAVEMIMRRLTGGSTLATQHLSLLPQLVVRGSCGARS